MLQEKNPSSGLRFEREKNASTKKTNAKSYVLVTFTNLEHICYGIILEAMSTQSHD